MPAVGHENKENPAMAKKKQPTKHQTHDDGRAHAGTPGSRIFRW